MPLPLASMGSGQGSAPMSLGDDFGSRVRSRARTLAAELDAEFAGWLREAYAVGDGAHLQAEGR